MNSNFLIKFVLSNIFGLLYRFRSGIDNTDMFSIGIGQKLPEQHNPTVLKNKTQHKIGAFECYSKGIGRKLLESQGWQEGQGLGRNKMGISEALTGKGQKPYNKRGLGLVFILQKISLK